MPSDEFRPYSSSFFSALKRSPEVSKLDNSSLSFPFLMGEIFVDFNGSGVIFSDVSISMLRSIRDHGLDAVPKFIRTDLSA